MAGRRVEPTRGVAAPAARSKFPGISRVLWADDRPERNQYEAASLRDAGLEIRQVRSTAEALNLLGSDESIDVVISDIGRTEDGIYREDAGLELARAVLERTGGSIPVLVYSTADLLDRYAQDLSNSGVLVATDSFTQLIAALRRTTHFRLEGQIRAILRQNGYTLREPTPEERRYLDVIASRNGQTVGVDAVPLSSRSSGLIMRDRLYRYVYGAQTLGVQELLVVTPDTIPIPPYEAEMLATSDVRLVSLAELPTALEGEARP